MYLIPPQARFDDSWLVAPAKSPRSMSATWRPRPASQAAETPPLTRPPRTGTRWKSCDKRITLVVRSFIRMRLRAGRTAELHGHASLGARMIGVDHEVVLAEGEAEALDLAGR